jgi:hypothetical protein
MSSSFALICLAFSNYKTLGIRFDNYAHSSVAPIIQ